MPFGPVYDPDYSFPDPEAEAEDKRGEMERTGRPPTTQILLICPECRYQVRVMNPSAHSQEVCSGSMEQEHPPRSMIPVKQ